MKVMLVRQTRRRVEEFLRQHPTPNNLGAICAEFDIEPVYITLPEIPEDELERVLMLEERGVETEPSLPERFTLFFAARGDPRNPQRWSSNFFTERTAQKVCGPRRPGAFVATRALNLLEMRQYLRKLRRDDVLPDDREAVEALRGIAFPEVP